MRNNRLMDRQKYNDLVNAGFDTDVIAMFDYSNKNRKLLNKSRRKLTNEQRKSQKNEQRQLLQRNREKK